MPSSKAAFEGNPFIGMYFSTSEDITLAPRNASPKALAALSVLGTKILHASVLNSSLLGLYTMLNSNGAIVPRGTSAEEKAVFKSAGLNVCELPSRKNACGNNIVANNKGAIANPTYDDRTIKIITDALGVEVVRLGIAGLETVGSCIVATNTGFIANNDASEDEIKQVESALHVQGNIGTVNMGSGFVRLGAIATSKGFIVGWDTSGFELMRVEQSLGFI